MNVRKLSVNKACIFLAVLLLAAMVTVSVALYIVFGFCWSTIKPKSRQFCKSMGRK